MLPAPVRLSKLTLAPAERAEVLVDFADAKRVRLLSAPDANDPMAGGMMRGMMGRMMGGMVAPPEAVNDDDEFEVLTFEVDAAKTVAITAVPERLPGAPLPSYGEPVRRRQFRLDMHTPGGGMMGGMGINGNSMDMGRIDEEVRLGETELWQVTANEMAHPFHIHGTSFQVVSHNGAAVDPAVSGMKDVVLVAGTAELLVRFDRVATRDFPYMYHCHILEHEDAGMMGQFTVS
jgi:FtsP/CotA-like multicopper oxidase with cupredoxin domain